MNGALLLALFGATFALLIAGVPIAVAIGVGAALAILVWGVAPIELATQMMMTSIDSWVLLAVPFFILSGVIIAESSIGRRLVDLFNALFGRLPGGLAVSAIFTCFLFGGLTGSAVAETAGVASIMAKPMERRGYPRAFTASLIACAGTNANLVPPSIALLIYGVVAKTSIADLFLAGVLPGLLFAVLLAATAMTIAVRRGYGTAGADAAAVERVPLGRAVARAGWALLAPVWILGGIRTGVFTPTESAFFITIYAFIVARYVYRDIGWRDLPRIVERAAVTTAAVMFIVACASIFAWIINTQGVPVAVANLMLGPEVPPAVLVLAMMALLTLAGMFLDAASLLLIVVPILLPVANGIGMDLVQFGIFVTLGVNLGLVTPPVGISLYVGAKVANAPVLETAHASLPWLGVFVVTTLLVAFVPAISLILL